MGVFKSGGVNIPLQNASGMFDPGNPSNFFVSRSLPANGRGAKVLLRITRDGAEVFNIAGEIAVLNQSLASSLVSLVVRDLSLRLRQKSVENFGTEITRRITDYEGANTDYDELNPVFYFPTWALLSQGSVTMTVEEGGSDVTINVVDAVATTGVLSNRNAEIDYSRGLIRFEAAPDNGENTVIDATWKRDYQYKRPDFLIRQLLKNAGIQDTLGITDDTDARFAIEQSLIRHPSDRIFSSNGRPYFEQPGLARWFKRDATNKKTYIAHDSRLVEYDESLDTYTSIATVPEDTSIDEVPPGGYGTALEDESVTLQAVSGFTLRITGLERTSNRIYIFGRRSGNRNSVLAFNLNGEEQSDERITVRASSFPSEGLSIFEGRAYVANRASSGNTRYVDVYNLATRAQDTGRSFSFTNTEQPGGIAITPTRIYVAFGTGSISVRVFEHDGTELANSGNLVAVAGIAVDNDYIYLSISGGLRVYDHAWNRVESAEFAGVFGRGLSITPTRLYTIVTGATINAFSAVRSLTYETAAVIQFDSRDFDSFYVLGTNTSRGDVLRDTTFNRNIITKYVRSTDTWSTLLDVDKGQPQIAHPYDFVDAIEYLTDNRKTFQVARRNNETLIFYRRATATQASISYYNETDDTITNVHTETYAGINDNGTPYSMDFALDERSDGIHVYSFVVRYTSTEATLKVFRERVQPSGTETEIFTETFTVTDDYPISVSDVILADDRSKFYFVLSYFNDDDETVAKAELCTIAKDGTGSRTVIKTYDNPLISARSPLESDGKYYYLEGGWPRLPKTSDDEDVPDAEHYYPDSGGHLIEVLSGDTVENHGVIGRRS